MRARQHAPSPERDVCFDGFLRLHVDVVPRLAGPVSATPIPPLESSASWRRALRSPLRSSSAPPTRTGRQSQLLRTRALYSIFSRHGTRTVIHAPKHRGLDHALRSHGLRVERHRAAAAEEAARRQAEEKPARAQRHLLGTAPALAYFSADDLTQTSEETLKARRRVPLTGPDRHWERVVS